MPQQLWLTATLFVPKNQYFSISVFVEPWKTWVEFSCKWILMNYICLHKPISSTFCRWSLPIFSLSLNGSSKADNAQGRTADYFAYKVYDLKVDVFILEGETACLDRPICENEKLPKACLLMHRVYIWGLISVRQVRPKYQALTVSHGPFFPPKAPETTTTPLQPKFKAPNPLQQQLRPPSAHKPSSQPLPTLFYAAKQLIGAAGHLCVDLWLGPEVRHRQDLVSITGSGPGQAPPACSLCPWLLPKPFKKSIRCKQHRWTIWSYI